MALGCGAGAWAQDGRSDVWDIDIAPDSDADVGVVLPATTDCAADGAVCTADGRRLSHPLEATVAGPLAPSGPGAAPPPATPNVVIILADDLGWGDVRAMRPESGIATPNIDRIAAQGVRFTDGHSPSAVCSPTRYGLLTGRYAWRTWLKTDVLGSKSRALIAADRPTLGTLMRSHGYRTATVGKWHIGMGLTLLSEEETTRGNRGIDFTASITDGPVDRGFDEFFGLLGNIKGSPYVFIRNDRFVALPTPYDPSNPGVFLPQSTAAPVLFDPLDVLDRLTDQALDFIGRSAADEAPFFLFFSLTAPHEPFIPAPRFRGLTGMGRYGDYVAQVDWTVGQVLAKLDAVGARDDTLVIFTSDNGSRMNVRTASATLDHTDHYQIWGYRPDRHRPNGDWRGIKSEIHEGGHRVPLLARWPAAVPAESVSDAVVTLTDLYATLADIVGESLAPGVAEDSVSLLDALRGRPFEREVPAVQHSARATFAVRDGPWKLIFGDGTGGWYGTNKGKPFREPWQLFDLSQDAAESSNRVDGNGDVVDRLTASLDAITFYADQERPVSDAADLTSLALSGVDFGSFDPDETTYAAAVDNALSSTTVTATPRLASSSVVVGDFRGTTVGTSRTVNLAEGSNPVTVTVTAPDLETARTYTVWVKRGALPSPDFAVTIAPSEISEGERATVTLAARGGTGFAEDRTFALAMSGSAAAADYELRPGSLTLPAGAGTAVAELAALADDEEEEPETVTITPSHGGVAGGSATVTIRSVSRGATLRTLQLSGIDFGAFDAGSDAYAAAVAHEVAVTTVSAEPSDPNATVTATPDDGDAHAAGHQIALAVGDNAIAVTVTPADGGTTRTYTVTVTRSASADARLSSLTLTDVDYGRFDAGIGTFNARAAHALSETTVAAEAAHAQARVAIAPGDADGGTPGHQVALAVGVNEIAVTVTAADGETTRAYYVDVYRPPSSDASLSSLTLTGVRLSGWRVDVDGFEAETTQYVGTAEHAVTETTVSAEPSHADAAVAIAPADADGGAAGHQAALSVGVNRITARVTAADGETTRTYVVAATRAGPALTAAVEDVPDRHDGSGTAEFDLRFSEQIEELSYRTLLAGYEVDGGELVRTRRKEPPGNVLWRIEVRPAGDGAVSATLPGGRPCGMEGAVCAADGRVLSNSPTARIPGPAPVVTIASDGSPVAEGSPAVFVLSRAGDGSDPLAVAVRVSETGEALSGTAESVEFDAGETTATLTLATDDDAVVEDASTVTATLLAGDGYELGETTTAAVTVEDDDTATFALTAAPAVLAEGGTSTVTVAIEDGATFADAKTIVLAVTGPAASDYALEPETLELAAGASAATAVLTALADELDEAPAAARIAALVDGAEVASATLTIRDASADARLAALALSEADIGPFEAETTVYAAAVAADVAVTTVTAQPADANAAVEIADAAGSTLGTARTSRLARGTNEIAATVTAEDRATTRTYTVTVTRDEALPWGTHLPERDIALGGDGESTGLWSDGAVLWALADWDGGAAQAYELATGARLRSRDLRLDDGFSQTALFSDGATLWAPSFYGGARAYALADGARLAERDLDESLSAAGNERPSGLWSDGSTRYVANLDDARLYAYAADGTRREDREFGFRTDDVQGGWPWGLWSDGETLFTSWHGRGRVLAYRLADGARLPERDIDTGAAGNDDPRDVWSDGATLWVADGADRKLYAYAAPGLRQPASGLLPVRVASRAHAVPSADPGAPVSIPDAGLRARIAAALGKAPDAPLGARELLALESLDARGAGIADLTGLGHAANLVAIDLGDNPLTDLRPLAGLANLDALNLDATGADPWAVAALGGLERLSLRDNGIGDVSALAGLAKLRALDLAGNVIEDVTPLAGLASLQALDLGGNRVEKLSPLARLGATVEVR